MCPGSTRSTRRKASEPGQSEGVADMTLSPLAESALHELCAVWQPERDQTTPQEGGFDWMPGSHRVRVRAASRDVAGAERVRLSVETDFLQHVPVHESSFCNQLGFMANSRSTTCALVYPVKETLNENPSWPATLTMFSSVYAYADTTPSLARLLARMAIINRTTPKHFRTWHRNGWVVEARLMQAARRRPHATKYSPWQKPFMCHWEQPHPAGLTARSSSRSPRNMSAATSALRWLTGPAWQLKRRSVMTQPSLG